MATPDATLVADVAGINGRIICVRNKPYIAGGVELGGSGHVGRMVLTAMEFDPCVRAAVNLSYSEKVLLICKDLGLSISSFDGMIYLHRPA